MWPYFPFYYFIPSNEYNVEMRLKADAGAAQAQCCNDEIMKSYWWMIFSFWWLVEINNNNNHNKHELLWQYALRINSILWRGNLSSSVLLQIPFYFCFLNFNMTVLGDRDALWHTFPSQSLIRWWNKWCNPHLAQKKCCSSSM